MRASTRLVTAAVLAAAFAAPAARAAGEARASRDEPTSERWDRPSSQLLWLDAGAGLEIVQLRTFTADFNSIGVGFLPSSGVGPMAKVGAGLRLGFLTLGARGRVASFQDASTVGGWRLWSLDGELGVRVPLGRVEPHLAFSAGYASFGGFSDAVAGLSDGLDVHGVDTRLGFGVDYWVADNVSIGVDADGALLFVARPGVSVRDLATAKQIGTINDAEARVLQASGSSLGWALALTGGVGVHF